MRLFLILLFTLISNAVMAQSGTTKVVVEDMGNVGYRITDAQLLVDWVTSGLRPRVERTNVMYEGLLKSKKDLQRRLGKTESHDAQSQEIKRLETFAAQAQVWVRARFGKDKKGHWVELTCRPQAKKPKKFTEKKRLYNKRFSDLKSQVAQTMRTFCPSLIPPAPTTPSTVSPNGLPSPKEPVHTPQSVPQRPKKWLPPQRR